MNNDNNNDNKNNNNNNDNNNSSLNTLSKVPRKTGQTQPILIYLQLPVKFYNSITNSNAKCLYQSNKSFEP